VVDIVLVVDIVVVGIVVDIVVEGIQFEK